MLGLYLTKLFTSVSINVRVNTAVVGVAEKKEVVVALPFFVDTVRIIARAPWLCSLNVANFTDVEIVDLYQLMRASGKRADVPGFREEGPNCWMCGGLPGHDNSGAAQNCTRAQRAAFAGRDLQRNWLRGPTYPVERHGLGSGSGSGVPCLDRGAAT